MLHMVMGSTGSGKTSVVKAILGSMKPDKVFIIDPMFEYEDYGIVSGSLSEANTNILLSGINPAEKKVSEKYNIVYQSEALDDDETHNSLFAYLRHLHNCTIIIDEAHLFCSPGYAPVEMSRLIRFHRHVGQELYIVSQCPKDLWVKLRSMCHEVYAFAMRENRDLQYMSQWFKHSDYRNLNSITL